MKRLFLLLLTISIYNITSNAQIKSNNSLRFGINYSIYEGDLNGISYSTDYAFALNKYISLAPGIFTGNSSSINNNNYNNITQMGATVVARVTPFAKKFHNFNFDIGFHYHYVTETSGSFTEVLNNEYHQMIQAGSYAKGNQIGLNFATSITIIEIKNIEFGLKIERNLPLTKHPYIETWQLGFLLNKKL